MASCSGGNVVLCTESSGQPSSESLDQAGDCADLSARTKNLLLQDKQCRHPDTETCQEGTKSFANNATPCFCNKHCVDVSEITVSVCVSTDSTGCALKTHSTDQCDLETSAEPNDSERNHGITLVDLPTEVLLQLCSYLDSRFLIGTLRVVCRRFYSILSDDFIWRSRIMRTWTQLYPAIPIMDEDAVDWRDACLHLEDQKKLWSNKDQLMRHTTWKNTHFSCVNSVLLVNDGAQCVSGSRDYSIAIWDVENFKEKPLAHVEGHKGWVWRLAADTKSTFYSCSFDNTLKLWSLEEGLQSKSVFDCKCPVMSIASAPNFAAVTLRNSLVCLFDPRCLNAPISSYNLVKGFGLVIGITCDNATPDLVVSGDMTGCVSVWDVRAGKMLKDLPMAKSKGRSSLPTPLSMSLRKDSCYFGDSKGQLHLMDPRRESDTAFEIVATYESDQIKLSKINAVRHGKGHLFAGGSDGLIYILAPTHEPEIISSFQLDTEISCMDYQNNILVVGCDADVIAYKPITPM